VCGEPETRDCGVPPRIQMPACRSIVLLLALMLPGAAFGQGAEFYRGRQINLVVGSGSGGGYDTYARVLARHIGRYLPGNPNVVVQNMPGAGGLRAANYLFNVAARDGSVIGTFGHDLVLVGALGHNPNVQFEPRRFTWLGSSSSFADDAYLLIAHPDAPVATAEAARRKGAPPLLVGASAEGGSTSDTAILLRDALGLNLKLVPGYPDSGAMLLAIERREIDARFTAISVLQLTRPEWLTPERGMKVLLQFARATRHPMFPDVPTARELAPSDKMRTLIELAELPFLLDRPYVAPPGIPPERARALQQAFTAVQQDSQYREDAVRLKIDVSPVGHEAALAAIGRIEAVDQETLDYMRKLLTNKGGG
jgi:tripartite-type tricarboxylate transporter receptor subunit TctC